MTCFSILKNRADFVAAARGVKAVKPSLILQARHRRDGSDVCRVGFTCSKKVGGAVTRNRAKRRLRAVAGSVITTLGQPGWDYVLIGRADGTINRSFADLEDDLRLAIAACHQRGAQHLSDPQASDRQ
ncbi:MAG: ribonuclease P protein component [Pseudomonadota bacterium]